MQQLRDGIGGEAPPDARQRRPSAVLAVMRNVAAPFDRERAFVTGCAIPYGHVGYSNMRATIEREPLLDARGQPASGSRRAEMLLRMLSVVE